MKNTLSHLKMKTKFLVVMLLVFASNVIAGEMNPDKLVMSIKAGDKIVVYNKANKIPGKAITPERKALIFTRAIETNKELSLYFMQGGKILSEELFKIENERFTHEKILTSNNRGSLILETSEDLSRVQLMRNEEDLHYSFEVREVIAVDEGINSTRTVFAIKLNPVEVSAGKIVRFIFTLQAPLEEVRKTYTISKLQDIVGEHAKFFDQKTTD